MQTFFYFFRFVLNRVYRRPENLAQKIFKRESRDKKSCDKTEKFVKKQPSVVAFRGDIEKNAARRDDRQKIRYQRNGF